MNTIRPEYDMKVIGANLRSLREENGLTVEEVRAYLCLGSVQAVYKYERGVSYPPADTLFALMELYSAELADIIGEAHSAHTKILEASPFGPASNIFTENLLTIPSENLLVLSCFLSSLTFSGLCSLSALYVLL